jgi:polar amino acid transport system substrate-binding protein
MVIAGRWLTVLWVLMISLGQAGLMPRGGFAQSALTPDPSPPTRRLKVGVKSLPPFVIKRPVQLANPNSSSQLTQQRVTFTGIDIAIWEAIAAVQKWEYDYFEYTSVEMGLAELNQGNLDVLVGALEITPERFKQVNFTQPYYFSHAALLVNRSPLPLWNYLHPFLKVAAFSALALVFLLISLFSHLIWLVERRDNPEHFPQQYWRGISQAYWFTAVTMTTVGYGDAVPITGMGRRLTFIWMWIGMVLTSSITAALASGFTLSVTQKVNTENLQNQDLSPKIVVIGEALNLNFLKDQSVPLVQVETLREAVDLLNRNQVGGILYFEDPLVYFQQTQATNSYELVGLDAAPIAYGFALRLNDPRLQEINVSLLEMMQSQQLKSILNQYSLGTD